MELTADNVREVVRDCLYDTEELPKDGSTPADIVEVEGIMNNFGFHPERLESHREDVRSMLSELPDDFHKNKGGGWSFLNMCHTKDGVQWGEHPSMDILLCLGRALGLAGYTMPREMWGMFPGGMPYVYIDLEDAPAQV